MERLPEIEPSDQSFDITSVHLEIATDLNFGIWNLYPDLVTSKTLFLLTAQRTHTYSEIQMLISKYFGIEGLGI